MRLRRCPFEEVRGVRGDGGRLRGVAQPQPLRRSPYHAQVHELPSSLPSGNWELGSGARWAGDSWVSRVGGPGGRAQVHGVYGAGVRVGGVPGGVGVPTTSALLHVVAHIGPASLKLLPRFDA